MGKDSSYQRGLWAEFFAESILRLKGYHILARRYKTPVGEIDIIARRRQMIAFVEVKQRGDLAQALGAVTPQMRRRIVRAAQYYLADRAGAAAQNLALRFDLFAFVSPLSWKHLDNAWQADS